MSGDVERLAEVIEREVYCTVIIRPEHDPRCNGDCGRYGCPIPVQDYGEISDLARAILASDWLEERDQRMQAAGAIGQIVAHGPQHPDMETYARIHNEGWDAAMLAQVAPDPTTADDWLAAHDAEVAARAWDEGMAQAGVDYMAGYDANVRGEPCPPPTQNPYRVAGHTPTGNTSEKEREETP